ncbi:hypothetical protein R69749_04033 [Paraburkholderia domus]|nr:hypothetical protein R69749_04033 [Paraburkholderia domus]
MGCQDRLDGRIAGRLAGNHGNGLNERQPA